MTLVRRLTVQRVLPRLAKRWPIVLRFWDARSQVHVHFLRVRILLLSDAQNPVAEAQEKPARVTTTVVVHAEVKDNYLSDSRAPAASMEPDKDTPLSVTAVSDAVISDQVARVLADVVKNDASVGEVMRRWLLRRLSDPRLSH
jgi:outer membrane receptor for monomeric catechols